MDREKIKNIIIYTLCILLFLYFGYSAYYFYNLSIVDETKVLTYSARDNSNYEVYYMNTNLIGGKSMGESFIKKYIDKVKINFDYNLEFSDKVNINSNYLIKATVIVYSPNGQDELWRSTSDYLLKETKNELSNTKYLNNKYSIELDYQKYLGLYEEFKQDTGIFSDAKILVEFLNNSDITSEFSPIDKNDTISYNIPLTNSTITISKTSSASGIKYTKTDNNKVMRREIKYLGLFFVYLVMAFICLIIIIHQITKYIRGKNEYKNTLKRILRDYNSIIVSIKKMPKLNDKKIVEVTDFSELVDVELELRRPINFIEKKVDAEAWFLIITSDITWIYKLIKKKGEKNEKDKKE